MRVPSEKREAFPLAWPDGWVRTRPQDQRVRSSWKRTANQYREELFKELDRSKVKNVVISTMVQLNMRGQMQPGIEPRDVGVAIYFSVPVKEDFRWQDALGIHDPAPTEDQINAAYRQLVAKYHPDKGGDVEMFRSLTQHRDNAIAWATQSTTGQESVIACDTFREVRWNIAAIAMTLKAMRQIESYGTSALLERNFKGFMALAADAGADAGPV